MGQSTLKTNENDAEIGKLMMQRNAVRRKVEQIKILEKKRTIKIFELIDGHILHLHQLRNRIEKMNSSITKDSAPSTADFINAYTKNLEILEKKFQKDMKALITQDIAEFISEDTYTARIEIMDELRDELSNSELDTSCMAKIDAALGYLKSFAQILLNKISPANRHGLFSNSGYMQSESQQEAQPLLMRPEK